MEHFGEKQARGFNSNNANECYLNGIAVYEVWLLQKLTLVMDKFVLLLFKENSDEALK